LKRAEADDALKLADQLDGEMKLAYGQEKPEEERMQLSYLPTYLPTVPDPHVHTYSTSIQLIIEGGLQ
jgi:hypothetical protein